jgi:hypothetical protein
MLRISTANRYVDKFGPGKDGFRAAVPGVSEPTYLSSDWCNAVQEGLVGIVEAANLAPSADNKQILDAISILIQNAIGAITRTVFDFMLPAKIAASKSGLPMNVTSAIQAALDCGARRVIFNAGATFVTSGNEVPSSRHLVFEHGSRLKLADGASRPALQNVNWKLADRGGNTYGVDTDITIEGLYLDGNEAMQLHTGTGAYAGEYTSGIRFFGVTNLVLKRMVIGKARTFGIWCASIDGLTAQEITFDQRMTGAPDNQDGLHINGPARVLDIRSIRGSTNDDMIALNADDGALGANVSSGPISDAMISGVYPNGSLNGIRLLSAASRIDRIRINDVVGTCRDPAINLSSYGMGAGNFGMVSIDGVSCQCSNALAGPDYYGVIVLDNNIENIVISNVQRSRALDDRATVLVLATANIGVLDISGVHTFSTPASGPIVTNEKNIYIRGLVNRMVLSDVDWFRDITLPRQGVVVWIDGADATKGVHTLIASNITSNRLVNVFHHSGGFLDRIYLTNVVITDGLPGGVVLQLESANQFTEVAMVNCYIPPGRKRIGTLNGARATMNTGEVLASGFEAYVAANQAIVAAYQKLLATGINYDRRSEYDQPNARFTAEDSGQYLLTVMLGIQIPTTGTKVVLRVVVNGAPFRYIYAVTHGANINLSASALLGLAAGSVVTLEIYMSNAGTVTAGANTSVWAVEKIKS